MEMEIIEFFKILEKELLKKEMFSAKNNLFIFLLFLLYTLF
jgi:hypothetical protein